MPRPSEYQWANAARSRAREKTPPMPSTRSTLRRALCVREDVEELDVETVCRAADELADPVLLLEAQHEGVHHVVRAVQLIEAEHDGRRLLAGDEQQPSLHVVGPAEIVSLLEGELPVLTMLHPRLDHLGERSKLVGDVDRDGRVRTFLRRRSWQYLKRRHDASIPNRPVAQTRRHRESG